MNIKQEIDAMINPTLKKEVSTITKQGIDDSVYYYVEKSNKSYVIQNAEIFRYSDLELLKSKLPKFGKYEIEEFFENRFLTALIITHDMTEIFNTTVYYSDFPRDTYFSSARVKEIFMEKAFDFVKEEKNIVYIALK